MRSGNGQESKLKLFKIRERSGNVILSEGKIVLKKVQPEKIEII